MKAATLAVIKKELKELSPEALQALCLRLARFKKDNKELLTYLLFEAQDENAYVALIKEEITMGFEAINTQHLYYAKKGIRKVLRNITRYIRYSGNKQTEIESLLFFCQTLRESGINFQNSTALVNLYASQVKKIHKALESLHEDLRYDYLSEVEQL